MGEVYTRPVVGPIMSTISGVPTITVDKTLDDIQSMSYAKVYQQPQLTHKYRNQTNA